MSKTTSWKDTNPKAAFAANKVPFHLWPALASATGAMGLLEGACKYGRSNWRKAGVRASTYVDALLRHVCDYFEGNDTDPDSGLPQFAHMLACCAILVDASASGVLVDDRQYKGAGYRRVLQSLTEHVQRIREKYADKNPKHYSKETEQEESDPFYKTFACIKKEKARDSRTRKRRSKPIRKSPSTRGGGQAPKAKRWAYTRRES